MNIENRNASRRLPGIFLNHPYGAAFCRARPGTNESPNVPVPGFCFLEKSPMEERIARICPYCGKKFVPIRPTQISCGNKACVRTHSDRERALSLEEKRAVRIQTLRRCHDYGRPTPDYRCSSCWKKLRRKRGLLPEERRLETAQSEGGFRSTGA